MFKRLVYGFFDTQDPIVNEITDLYHSLKREKCNKKDTFCDFMIKLQMVGRIRHGTAPTSIILLNPKIIYFMAVQANIPAHITGRSIGDIGGNHIPNRHTMSFEIVQSGGNPLFPNIKEKKEIEHKRTSNIANIVKVKRGIQDSPLTISGKITKSSKWATGEARVKLYKKGQLKMGVDPLSFYPEIHFIDSRMHWRNFFHNLNVTFEVTPSSELRGMYSSYKNAKIISWHSMIDNVYIYQKTPTNCE
jgi:hypothetical protein